MLDVELPPKIIPQVTMEEMWEKYIFLKVSWDNIDVTDLIAKQVKFNFHIILSVWYFQDKVPSKNNPQNSVWVVLFMQ
jgi:hypothetical protein